MDRLRRWIQDWLQTTEGSWNPAMAESRARAMAMEARLTAIETALDDKGAESAMTQWETPDMDAHLGAN